MNSTSKFAKYFYRLINEDVDTGALGDGSSVRGGIYTANDPNSKDGYNTGSAVIAEPLGKKKKRVQKRMFPENEEGDAETRDLRDMAEKILGELEASGHRELAARGVSSVDDDYDDDAINMLHDLIDYGRKRGSKAFHLAKRIFDFGRNGLKEEDNQVKQKFSKKYADTVEKEFEDHVRLRSPDGKLGVKLPPGNKKEIEDYKKKGYKEEEAEDRCKRKADSVYGNKTSAYKSGAIVRCRKGKIWKKK